VLLSNPNRLLIEISGPTERERRRRALCGRESVVSQVQVGSDAGKIRLTLMLQGDQPPVYSVDDPQGHRRRFLGDRRAPISPCTSRSSSPARRARRRRAPCRWRRRAGLPRAAASMTAPPPPGMPLAPPPLVQVNTETGSSPRGKRLYYGQPISLDLKDADVHNVIRLLGDVSGINIVATDDVTGQITLRLNDVPWDQALDIVMQAQNLESVQEGNVLHLDRRRLREEREE
jgi:type IV pilus assembly protein PilQ